MHIHHVLEGFINSWQSNDDKFPGTCLVDHEMFTPTLDPKSNTNLTTKSSEFNKQQQRDRTPKRTDNISQHVKDTLTAIIAGVFLLQKLTQSSVCAAGHT